MSEPDPKCVLCEADAQVSRDFDRMPWVWQFECGRCGTYLLHDDDRESGLPKLLRSVERYKLAALSYERANQSNQPMFFVVSAKADDLDTSRFVVVKAEDLLKRWPETVPERLNRALLNLGRIADRHGAGHTFELKLIAPSLVFARDVPESYDHIRFLLTDLLVDPTSLAHGSTPDRRILSSLPNQFRISADGWRRIAQLRQARPSPDNSAFVAMWFGHPDKVEEMSTVYDQGIAPAILRAGYKPDRSDTQEHNQWIMDKIMADIKAAPFIVADLTEHNNGVYFEAGFAR